MTARASTIAKLIAACLLCIVVIAGLVLLVRHFRMS
jgi:hypothetical protein